MLRSMQSARTYVGYTRQPRRRCRQHNGELPGGAAPTAGRPWELVFVVRGFRSKHAALAFESAWQKPHSSRHISRAWKVLGFGKCGGSTCMRVRLEALCLLLEHGVWVRVPLSVHVLCDRVPHVWEPLLARVRQRV